MTTMMIDTAQEGGQSAQQDTPGVQLSEHEQAMLEKSKQVAINGTQPESAPQEQQQDAPQEERPSWLPEKFKTVDDFVKSYGELEKKLGSKQPAEEKPTEPAAGQETGQLNFDAYYNEWAEKGALGEESYAVLEKAGIPKQVVDAYIAGSQALQMQRAQEGFALAGGQEGYQKMTQWAKVNLPRGEIEAFNTAVAGSPEQMQLAVRGMFSKYQSAVGKMPALLNGSASSNNAQGGFRSRAEVVSAMSDARYESDSAYRKSVMDRLSLTSGDVI